MAEREPGRPDAEGLEGDWSQSWERPSAEDDRHMTAGQWVLAALICVLAAALGAMGIYWYRVLLGTG